MAEKTIGIKIRGGGILPENLRAGDLADLIKNFESAIVSTALKNNSKLKKEDVVIGLVGIKRGSITLELVPQLSSIVYPSFQEITYALNNSDYSNLPQNAVDGLREITTFARKHHCEIDFGEQNGKLDVWATLTSETVVNQTYLISGRTTIYGIVLRVGGADPAVWLRLPDGESLICKTNISFAKRLAEKLYSWVGLEGIAKWNSGNLKVEEFEIKEITEYENESTYKAFKELESLIGPYYREIDNPDQYIYDLREEKLED